MSSDDDKNTTIRESARIFEGQVQAFRDMIQKSRRLKRVLRNIPIAEMVVNERFYLTTCHTIGQQYEGTLQCIKEKKRNIHKWLEGQVPDTRNTELEQACIHLDEAYDDLVDVTRDIQSLVLEIIIVTLRLSRLRSQVKNYFSTLLQWILPTARLYQGLPFRL